MEKSPISETSWWAVIADPDGNAIGLYEGAEPGES
jgi:predicted enzyme related to lactoylglutathione lyase